VFVLTANLDGRNTLRSAIGIAPQAQKRGWIQMSAPVSLAGSASGRSRLQAVHGIKKLPGKVIRVDAAVLEIMKTGENKKSKVYVSLEAGNHAAKIKFREK
jgi:hypothetical protein